MANEDYNPKKGTPVEIVKRIDHRKKAPTEENIPDRVIEQGDVRLAHLLATLYYLDNHPKNGIDLSSFDIDYSNGSTIKVYNDDMETLGSATIRRSDGKVMADLFINYNCPERLSIDIGEGYYAIGQSMMYKGLISTKSICLSRYPTLDARIGPVVKVRTLEVPKEEDCEEDY